jgi:very-short-patch-repair endonuclease
MLSKFKKLLRKSQTDAESIVWYNLRNRYLRNHKFRRQHVLHGYIVDFVCLKKRLVIELDGSQHMEQEEYDSLRTKTLENNGFKIIRFWNCDVLENLNGVLEVIYEALGVKSTPHPPPSASTSPTGGEVIRD